MGPQALVYGAVLKAKGISLAAELLVWGWSLLLLDSLVSRTRQPL